MPRPTPRELLFALALVVASLAGAGLNHDGIGNEPAGAFAVCLCLLGMIGALAFARQPPQLGLALVAAVALTDPVRGAVALPLLAALFLVALRCDRQVTVVAVAVVSFVLTIVLVLSHGLTLDRNLAPLVPWSVAIGLATAAGLYLHARRDYIESLRTRAEQAEREQVLLAEQAVAEERVRIARELHDVVAHGVSLMVVQAQALPALGEDERNRTAARIATVGRDSLAEMHRMLDVLRPSGAEEPEFAPAPGVRDIPALVDGARAAGLAVELGVDGEPHALPVGVDLSAYRIVQEALTNVIKHARALRTEVRLRYRADALELTVTDDGAGADDGGGPAALAGHGLVGMRERVALFGGTLEAGSRSDGATGYVVRAVLPL
jgi:signal transduction histidine kinase